MTRTVHSATSLLSNGRQNRRSPRIQTSRPLAVFANGRVPCRSPRCEASRPLAVFASPRRALTLVEIVLVLALLVMIGALAVPALSGSFARARLERSADLVQAAWSRARLAAIESGETHLFRCQPQGSAYQVATLAALQAGQLAPPPATDQFDTTGEPARMMQLEAERLPGDVVFVSARTASTDQQDTAVGAAVSDTWSAPISFYADGTTSDATVLLANELGQQMRVTLRGLTGTSAKSDLLSGTAP